MDRPSEPSLAGTGAKLRPVITDRLAPASQPGPAVDGEPTWVWLDEHVRCGRKARRLLRWIARQFGSPSRNGGPPTVRAVLKAELDQRAKKERLTVADHQRLRVCASVLFDLGEHGWRVRVTRRRIEVASPRNTTSRLDEKERVRSAHLIERDNQLVQPATNRFIRSMERRRLTGDGWKSIFSLMRDGRGLADQLPRVVTLAASDERAAVAAARACIDPYVQVISPGQVDAFTGLRLMDVWRYFRHTWTTTYQSTPGRKLFVLIRDRAAPDHPIIGIGALGSAIVQMSERDRYIGWNSETFLQMLEAEPTTRWAEWVNTSLKSLVASIYRRDLLAAGHVTAEELRTPTSGTVKRLREAAKRAREAHHLFAHVGNHKAATTRAANLRGDKAPRAPEWKKQALTYLFQAKRTATLADLLDVRRRLKACGFNRPTGERLALLLSKPAGRRAVQTILRHVRAAHVGVDMLDITVCGAVAPYGALLGGKLASLLMASPQVVTAYRRRYQRAQSVIASSMAARPVRRAPRLVLLGTTSLYGIASSQYNRIFVPAAVLGSDGPLRYECVGRTAGFGSYHFSRETMAELEIVAAQGRRGREVNSIFGEGVNPKLRKVRVALDAMGLPSDALLQHGSPRLIYVVPLATNFRDVLLGKAKRPKYLLGLGTPSEGTNALVDFWMSRWLIPRISRDGVLEAVRSHTLAYPIRHGARVPLPEGPPDPVGSGLPS